jgi:hypothetical protein
MPPSSLIVSTARSASVTGCGQHLAMPFPPLGCSSTRPTPAGMAHAPVPQQRVRDRARRSHQDAPDLEAIDSALIASPGASDELARREPMGVAASVRCRRFQELVAAVAHGSGSCHPTCASACTIYAGFRKLTGRHCARSSNPAPLPAPAPPPPALARCRAEVPVRSRPVRNREAPVRRLALR